MDSVTYLGMVDRSPCLGDNAMAFELMLEDSQHFPRHLAKCELWLTILADNKSEKNICCLFRLHAIWHSKYVLERGDILVVIARELGRAQNYALAWCLPVETHIYCTPCGLKKKKSYPLKVSTSRPENDLEF